MQRLVRHSGQDVDRFSISCRWKHMKPWNLQRWSISSEVGAQAPEIKKLISLDLCEAPPGRLSPRMTTTTSEKAASPWSQPSSRRPWLPPPNPVSIFSSRSYGVATSFSMFSHPICAGTPPAVADVLIVLQRGVHVLMQDGIMKVNVVEKLSDTELKARWHWEISHAAWWFGGHT